MGRLSLSLFGGFRGRMGSGRPLVLPRRKAEALLAYLALRPAQAQSRDAIVALLWGDVPAEQGRQSLRQTLFDLRQKLTATHPPVLIVERATIALNPHAVEVDVVIFERLVAEGTPEALDRAVSLYEGELLTGFRLNEPPFEEWLRAQRERLRELALDACRKLLTHQTGRGAVEPAIQTAMRLLALDPLQETVHRTLMRLYVEQGRRAAALRQYQACVDELQRELGVDPEPETRQLYQELLPDRSRRIQVSDAVSAPAGPRRRGGSRRFRHEASIPETPLIGREIELGQLRQALNAAWRGRGQVVTILGEAGSGKTRLVEELAEIALRRGGHVVIGRCYETEQIFPFGPWVDLLRTAIKGHEFDGFSPVWQAELSQLLPELGESRGSTPASTEGHLRLFDAIVHLLRRLAGQQPHVLIVDDLHWADEMSLRLLSFLGRRLEGVPMFMVGTSRDDEVEGARSLRWTLDELDRDHRLVRLMLPPLSREHTVELVQALARPGHRGNGLAALGEQIWVASEGNPFVIVETVRAVREGGETLAAGLLPMPQRVRRLIGGRLERLSHGAQHLAGVAAVIGREFDFALLQRASGVGDGDSAAGVEELVRRRVLQGVADRFRFSHDRIREAAYARLLAPSRRLLHGAVARAIEELYADDLAPHYVALATHCREAEAWDKASTYFHRAGVEAYVRWGHHEAIACFEQAMAALRRLPETRQTLEGVIDLRIDLRRAYHFLAEPRPAIEHLRAAEALAQALGDERRLGYLLNYLCIELQALGDYALAVEAGERAAAIAAALGDLTLGVEATSHLGQAHLGLGTYHRARQLLERAVTDLEHDQRRERSGQPSRFAASRTPLFARFPRSAHLSGARFHLTRCLYELGEFREATARAEATVREVEATDEPNMLARTLALLGLGFVDVARGEPEPAIPILERALDTCQRGNVSLYLGVALAGLGHAYAVAGRVAEGLPLLERAVELTSPGANVPLRGLLADAYLKAGQLDRAAAAATSALEAAGRRTERGYEARMVRILGDVASRQTPPRIERAESHYRDALTIATERGQRPLAARCHFGLGALYAAAGRTDEAQAQLCAAVELFRSMEMSSWLCRAERILAEVGPRATTGSR